MTAPEKRKPGGNRAHAKTLDTASFYSTPAGGDVADLDKRFATARARLALAGFSLHAVDNHGHCEYLVTRWNLSRSLHSLAAVEAFAAQVGAQP